MQIKIGKGLYPTPKGDNRYEFSTACYKLTSSERYCFIEVSKVSKVPYGYASNIFSSFTIKIIRSLG